MPNIQDVNGLLVNNVLIVDSKGNLVQGSLSTNIKAIPGVVYDGITDDSVAIQTYIDNTSFRKLKLEFPIGYCKCDFTIKKPDIIICGEGTIVGSITIDADLVDNVQPDLRYKIKEVEFEKGAYDYAIRLRKARKGKIFDATFCEGIKYPIYFEENSNYSQLATKLTVDRCTFDETDYSIYVDNNKNDILALDYTALADGTTTTITEGIINPLIMKKVYVVGNVSGITGDVVINGTNSLGGAISETITSNGITPVYSTINFTTITSIVLPSRNAAGNTIKVGYKEYLGVADVHVTNCMMMNKIQNVKIKGIDGFISFGNTYFLPGSNEQNAEKQYNISIDLGVWIQIFGGNLFEAGKDSILLSRCTKYSVFGNNIAWPGQHTMGSGIKAVGGNMEGGTLCLGNINSNNIEFPTEHGIYIKDNCGGINVNSNVTLMAGSSQKYYGETELGSIAHWGFKNDATTQYNIAVANNSPQNNNLWQHFMNFSDCNFDKDRNSFPHNRPKTESTNQTVVGASGYELIYLVNTAPTTILDITGKLDNKVIKFLALNGNTTFKFNSTIVPKTKADYLVPDKTMITFQCQNNVWYEI